MAGWGWMVLVFQVGSALSVLALGIVLGRVWEARTKKRSKRRIRRQDAGSELVSSHSDMRVASTRRVTRHNS